MAMLNRWLFMFGFLPSQGSDVRSGSRPPALIPFGQIFTTFIKLILSKMDVSFVPSENLANRSSVDLLQELLSNLHTGACTEMCSNFR